jgi:hypothetical protein
MKKLMIAVLLFVAMTARADTLVPVGVSTAPATIPEVSTAAPAALATIADGLLAGKVLTGSTLRDVINGHWMIGAEAPLYKKFYVSPDLGIAAPIDVANAHGMYYLSGRVWAGQLLYDKIPLVKQYADATSFTATLLQYGTIGAWGGRDFMYGVWRAGYDIGLTVRFKTTGYAAP